MPDCRLGCPRGASTAATTLGHRTAIVIAPTDPKTRAPRRRHAVDLSRRRDRPVAISCDVQDRRSVDRLGAAVRTDLVDQQVDSGGTRSVDRKIVFTVMGDGDLAPRFDPDDAVAG